MMIGSQAQARQEKGWWLLLGHTLLCFRYSPDEAVVVLQALARGSFARRRVRTLRRALLEARHVEIVQRLVLRKYGDRWANRRRRLSDGSRQDAGTEGHVGEGSTPEEVLIAKAGAEAANGLFMRAGTHLDAPYYAKAAGGEGGGGQRMLLLRRPNVTPSIGRGYPSEWVIVREGEAEGEASALYAVGASATSVQPPRRGWAVGPAGVAPAPLIEAKTAPNRPAAGGGGGEGGAAPRAMARVIPLMGPSPSIAVTERVILTMRNDVEVSRNGAAVGAPTAQAGVAIRCFGGHIGDGWMAIGGDEGFLKVGADGFDLFASRPTHQCLRMLT